MNMAMKVHGVECHHSKSCVSRPCLPDSGLGPRNDTGFDLAKFPWE